MSLLKILIIIKEVIMDIKLLLGKRIREYRLKHKLTQSQLAEKLGIDDKHLSRIELGKNMPNPQLLETLSEIFGIEIKDLFEFSHLNTEENIRQELHKIIETLDNEQLVLAIKYLRTFVI